MELRIVDRDETKSFSDDKGNELVCVSRVTSSQWDLLSEIVQAEQFGLVNKFGLNLQSAVSMAPVDGADQAPEQQQESTPNEQNERDEIAYLEYQSPKATAFRFEAIAVRLKIKEKTIADINELSDVYGRLELEGRAWIDKQVEEIWRASLVTSAEKK